MSSNLKKEENGELLRGGCVIALPPRNDTIAVIEESWQIPFPDGIDFEGQHFVLPDGCSVGAAAQWLEPSLLSVRISVGMDVEAPCARCLKPAALAISDELMYLYYLHGLEFGEDTELESDDGFMPVEVDFFGKTLDLAPQIEESVLLLLPAKILCREDCAGLCPRCGADLNEGPCACGGDEGDPRFEALRNLKLE